MAGIPDLSKAGARQGTSSGSRRALLGLGAISLVSLFLGLDRIDFVDDREARDALVARECVEQVEWIVPVLGHEPWIEKPLLGYLPDIAGLALTPASPVGPRAVRSGLAVALVLLTGALGTLWFGRGVGGAAAAVLASSLVLPFAARIDGLVLLSGVLGWGALGLGARAAGGRGGPGSLAIAYLAIATLAVTAGPLHALWPMVAMALAGHGPRGRGTWHPLHVAAGLAIVVGLALPWYVAFFNDQGPAGVLRAAGFPYGLASADPWYWTPMRALGFLMVGLFPWSLLLPSAVVDTTRGGVGKLPDGVRFARAGLAGSLLPAMLTPGAPMSALLLAAPGAALVCARLVDRAFAGDATARATLRISGRWLAVAGTMVGLLLLLMGPREPELRQLTAIAMAAAWAPALVTSARRPGLAIALFALPVAVGAPWNAIHTLPSLAGHLTTGAVALAMGATPAGAPIVLLEDPPASLRLRAERNLVVAGDLGAALRAHRSPDGSTYVAFRPGREAEVRRSSAAVEILARSPALCLARVGTP